VSYVRIYPSADHHLPAIGTHGGFFCFGDSKTYHGFESGGWALTVVAACNAASQQTWHAADGGASGAQIKDWQAVWDASYWAHSLSAGDESYCLMNFGVNDALPQFFSFYTEASWKGYFAAAVAQVLSQWPTTKIYVAQVWGQSEDANCDTIDGWIAAAVVTEQAAGHQVSLAHDERVWLKGADNGATMTSDGVHYSFAAGHDAAAARWRAVLWP
jgi:hypothetical protein